jgi:hypothetical protein
VKQELIKGCVAIEKMVALIYSQFMQLFPEEKVFWENLYKDEIRHSLFLIEAGTLGLFNDIKDSEMLLTVPLIHKTLNFAEKISVRVQSNPVSLEDALKLALKLEESIVETFANDMIAVFSAGENRMTIQNMLAEEGEHVDKIRNKMIEKGYIKVA